MRIYSFSAQPFENRQGLCFDPAKYSKFKYGSKSIAREFGYELGRKFLHSLVYQELQMQFDLTQIPITVCSAPYKFTPTASFALKDYFGREFNKYHALKFGKSIEDIKVFRKHSYHEDYSVMNRVERDKAITADDFHIDEKFIQNKILCFIDDVKITGSHQSRIETLLRSVGFRGAAVFLFYAELTGVENAHIESYLNRSAITDLEDIARIIREDEFAFNTRVIKFILEREENEFKTFIDFQTNEFNETLLQYALGNEYFKEPKYQENLLLLQLRLSNFGNPLFEARCNRQAAIAYAPGFTPTFEKEKPA